MQLCSTSRAGALPRSHPSSSAQGRALSPLRTCSPEQRRAAFRQHRISHARWAEHAPALLADADLYCRLGDCAYPWAQAAPAVLGSLAFPGSQWQDLLGPGLSLAPDPPPGRSKVPSIAQQSHRLSAAWL